MNNFIGWFEYFSGFFLFLVILDQFDIGSSLICGIWI